MTKNPCRGSFRDPRHVERDLAVVLRFARTELAGY
jgi:hypothetical protein